jgi:ParB/RepB/Spo0J family partition protein
MTTTTQNPAAAWTLTYVAPTTIKAHPDNPRTEVTDVDDLAASIGEVGILEPLVVAPPHTGMNARSMGKATHLLIAGHRRLAAAKKAKLATVPVIVRADLTTRAEQVEAMLVENLQRVDLTPVEEADAYQLVMTLDGLTQTALAAKVGQPVSRIRDRLKLTKISQPVRDKIQAHQITIADALAVAEFDDDPKVQKDLLKKSGNDLQHAVNRARIDRQHAVERAELLERLTAAGVPIHKEQPKGSKDLGDLHLDPKRHWVSSTSEVEANKLHKDCPGRAAWQHYSSIYFGCTQPKLHPRPKVTKSEAEQQREAREKSQLVELEANLDAATRVRGDFLRTLILGARMSRVDTKTTLSRARLRSLVHTAMGLDKSYYYGDQLKNAAAYLTFLTGDAPAREKGTDDPAYAAALTEAIDTALADADVFGLVAALDLATHVSHERQLRTASLYPIYEYQAEWIAALTAYGYEWTTFERERFTWAQEVNGKDQAWGVDGAGEFIPDDLDEDNAVDVAHDDAQDEAL